MVTDKQLAANRQNALKSTGPRSAEGKTKSSRNAVKHGILSRHLRLSTESKTEFDRFRAEMFEALAPQGAVEILHTDRAVVSAWQLRRTIQAKTENLEGPIAWRRSEIRDDWVEEAVQEKLRIETRNHLGLRKSFTKEDFGKRGWEKYQQILEETEGPTVVSLGPVFSEEKKYRDLHGSLSRYEIQHENSMYRALRELERLQARRRGQPVLAPVAVDVAVTGSEAQNN